MNGRKQRTLQKPTTTAKAGATGTTLQSETRTLFLTHSRKIALAAALSFGIIFALERIVLDSSARPEFSPEQISVEPVAITAPTIVEEPESNSFEPVNLLALNRKLAGQYPNSAFEDVANTLLSAAGDFAAQQDYESLAENLVLLSVNELRMDDIATAAVYLDEALSVYEELGDNLGIAEVEILRANVSIKSRENARRAAYAYDSLQVARWKVANGYFEEAVPELKNVISENLSLKRFGAAAEAYETLYKGYERTGQMLDAQTAGIEIVKLHAASGRPTQAETYLQKLRSNGLDEISLNSLSAQMVVYQQDYEKSVKQIGQAKDYQQLYNHFIHAGDPVRAWQFRIKAQRAVRDTSTRAMHRRQTGVLALLFSSNDTMAAAHRSLTRASQIAPQSHSAEINKQYETMREQIF